MATAILAVALGVLAPPAAASITCGDDGLADFCVTSGPGQDTLDLHYQITQIDGPGSYSVYYEDSDTGVASAEHAVGPLAFQRTETGTLHAPLNHCYDVHLDSDTGSSLIVGPVC